MEAEAAAVAAQAAVTRAVAEALCPNLSRGVLSATFTGTRGCGTWVRAGRGARRLPPPRSWGSRGPRTPVWVLEKVGGS